MRQRNIKNLDEKIELCSGKLIKEPAEAKGHWHGIFGNSNPICLEIGSGKGKFISELAKANPGINYIALEGQANVALRVLEKSEALENLRVIISYINDMNDFFEPGEVSGIYLNFSDPWPKARHEKRRLTYRGRLLNYRDSLGNGGFVEFKTDNDGLFDFTVGELEALGIEPCEFTRDLHASAYGSKNTTTEYEDKFSSRGKNINYLKIIYRQEV